MALITINGTAMPEPSSISVSYQDLDSDSTKRNEKGVLQRDRVRQGVHKLSLRWPPLSQSDAETILNAVKPASFSVKYLDPATASYKTSTMYVGDRSCEMQRTALGWRWNISFDLIEY